MHLRFERGEVAFNGAQGVLVVLGLSEFEQVFEVGGRLLDIAQVDDDIVELTFFLAEFLSLLGIVPDGRVFQRAGYFFEFRRLFIVVKDTSEVRDRGPAGRLVSGRGR
ncbi:hypothetical protein AzCIB_1768 [Azoarcus sp. CIB]|nr:hypothetical protein AzCIB_1768 [Azoarcus sp. CIB]